VFLKVTEKEHEEIGARLAGKTHSTSVPEPPFQN
jgi:hypothetical protein